MNSNPPARQQTPESHLAFEQKLREINEALIVSSVHQHELADKAEAIAREKETHYRTLFDTTPVAIYSCNVSGVIQDFNHRAAELWGREPVSGDTDDLFCGSFKLFHRDGSFMPHEQCPMADVVKGTSPEVCDMQVQIERPDGSRVTVLVNIRPLKNISGEITGAINCFYDITERVQFERERATLLANEQASQMEAQAANRAKDLFLATLSHEVRTPLNAIRGWASILRKGKPTEAEIKEGMEVIERNCRAQSQLMEDVMDVARIVSGKLRLHLCNCNLAEVINAAIDVVRPAADAKGVRIVSDLDPAAGPSSCDKDRMQQVVWNILSNAVKFTPRGGTVRVELDRERSRARIRVTDEGQGISAEFLPYVFDRFRQADSTTRRQFGGLGLGLSIVKHIVELHGGIVRAESDGEGCVATFSMEIPVRAVHVNDGLDEATASGDVSTPTLPPVPLNGLQVLVVDDEADARRLLSKVLGESGATVTAVGSVTEALAAVAAIHPHMLVSDVGIPGQDGYDLIRQLRGMGLTAKELPAVALTAFAHKNDQRRVMLAGFQIHIPKPVDPHDLIAVIASLAGRTG